MDVKKQWVNYIINSIVKSQEHIRKDYILLESSEQLKNDCEKEYKEMMESINRFVSKVGE
jgi:hypothetical protein